MAYVATESLRYRGLRLIVGGLDSYLPVIAHLWSVEVDVGLP